MKTRRSLFRKIGELIMLTLFISFTQSCETEVPPEDLTPPKFSFQIHGDGFYHVFDQDTDFDNIILKLKRGTTFQFTLSGGDFEGLERIQWTISPFTNIQLNTPVESPWELIRASSLNPDAVIQWIGDENNPLTGSVIQGSFTTPDRYDDIRFRFTVADYGGVDGTPNRVDKELFTVFLRRQTQINPR